MPKKLLKNLILAAVALLSSSPPSWAADPPTYTFSPSGHDGGGGLSAIAADPFTPGGLIAGGDIWGLYRSSDHGRDWTPSSAADPADTNSHFSIPGKLKNACVRFSERTQGRVYAGHGESGRFGGFSRSDNGGETWIMTSTTPQFSGANTNLPLDDKGHPRSVGNLIAVDPNFADADGGGEFIYAGTYKKSVMRSHNGGVSWTAIALPGLGASASYIRGVARDDLNFSTIYACTWDTDGDSKTESVYKIANARTASSGVNLNAPFLKAEEVVVIHGVLYVAANTSGVWKYDGANWTQLYTDTKPSLFYSIDGYWDSASSQAVIYAGTATAKSAGNSLYYSVMRSTNSGASWTCITKDSTELHTNMKVGDASGNIWWHSDELRHIIGGSTFVACQTLVDPFNRNTLYVCGRGGMWRTDNALAASPSWYAAVRHMNGSANRGVAVDPNHPMRGYTIDMDWTFQYTTNGFDTIKRQGISSGGQEEFCVEVDSTSNPSAVSPVYVGRDGALAYNANPASSAWVDTKMNLQGSQNVLGCSIKRTAAGTVVLAAVEGSGIWRKIGGGANGSWGGGPVYTADNILKGLHADNQKGVFSWGGGNSQMVYFTDRENGVFRSMDAGVTWSKIAGPGAGSGGSTKYSGSVAVDPTDERNCYVTQTSGVWFSGNANAPTPTFTKITLSGGGTPGWADYDDQGNIYINTLITDTKQPKLFFKARGGSQWHNIGTDNVFRAQNGFVSQMVVGPGANPVIYLVGNGVSIGRKQVTETAVAEFQRYE